MSTSVVLPFARVPTKTMSALGFRWESVRENTQESTFGAPCRGLCFDALQSAYDNFGGSDSTDRIVQRLRADSDQPVSILAHWIVDRNIVLFARNGRTLIPTFQFTGDRCARKAAVANVIAELRSEMDDWELATWFVTPNTWLKHAMPASLIDLDARRVHEAARVDRFIARG